MTVLVELCNAAVCSVTDPIPIIICEENEEEREENIQSVLEIVILSFLF